MTDPNLQLCLQSFSDMRLKNHFDNLMMSFVSYFPFVVKYIDAYGKQTYDYLNKITQVIAYLNWGTLKVHKTNS